MGGSTQEGLGFELREALADLEPLALCHATRASLRAHGPPPCAEGCPTCPPAAKTHGEPSSPVEAAGPVWSSAPWAEPPLRLMRGDCRADEPLSPLGPW